MKPQLYCCHDKKQLKLNFFVSARSSKLALNCNIEIPMSICCSYNFDYRNL